MSGSVRDSGQSSRNKCLIVETSTVYSHSCIAQEWGWTLYITSRTSRREHSVHGPTTGFGPLSSQFALPRSPHRTSQLPISTEQKNFHFMTKYFQICVYTSPVKSLSILSSGYSIVKERDVTHKNLSLEGHRTKFGIKFFVISLGSRSFDRCVKS